MKTEFYKTHRLRVIKNMTIVITVFVCIFFFIDFHLRIPVLSFIEFTIALSGIVLCFKFETWITQKTISIYSLIFTNTLFIFLLVTLCINGFSNTAHLWIISVPMGAYMMTGLTWGLRITIFYITLSVFILLYKQLIHPINILFSHYVDVTFLVVILWILAHFYEKSNQFSKKSLIEVATKDFLTKLNNRHLFYDIFTKYHNENIALILIDLDWFKKVNDTYGHDCGDYTLTEVARILRQFESDTIYAFRLGGEEFALLSINMDNEQVYKLTNDILIAIRENSLNYENNVINITASIGIAISTDSSANLNELTRMADSRLYQAKTEGRNRIVVIDE